METLNFNGIEWEVLDTPIAKRYSEFLKDRIDTKQFFYMGETKTQIKDEIEKIAYMKGAPSMDLNELHEYFADHGLFIGGRGDLHFLTLLAESLL